MSPFTDPTSQQYINPHARDVTKRSPNTLGDWLLAAFIVGLFAVGTIMTLLTQ
jgi:hypothetical protein